MPREIDTLIAQLDLDEKCALLAGAGLWSTVAVPRAGIPAVQLTDGPNGARGPSLPAGLGDAASPTSVCAPCGAALGATWDTDLVARVGALIGREARRKASRVLLAPTVNLHRSPLGGRNFESYSEDPLLAGRIAAAFVSGAQGEGVACTVKHFAGNESETDRFVANTVADERTLRELYLLPFELAVREGGVLGVMTAYNRLNGEHCSDSSWLLRDVLRGDWGFDGFVVSDWFALADTGASIAAGLDLEMPGPGRAYGGALAAAVRAGTVDELLVDDALARLLGVLDRISALDDAPAEPESIDLPEDRALVREAAAGAMVLLRNEGVLPLDASRVTTVALLGPNAGRAVIMGGGSASLPVHRLVSPLDALQERLGARVRIVHEPGVDISLVTPEIPGAWLRTPDGASGMHVTLHDDDRASGAPLGELDVATGSAVWIGAPPLALASARSFRARTTLRVPDAGRWVLSLVQTGPASVAIDGTVVLDRDQDPPPGAELFGMASRERTVTLELDPARPVEVELCCAPGDRLARGAKLGLRRAAPGDGIERAVRAAAAADVTIVVVGSDQHWEGEGGDRTTFALPGEQDELVARVLDVAPDAVVVCNTGSPFALPWRERVKALLQVWFGGQEMAHALVDVLFGAAEPGGRLPATFPLAIEDTPSYGNFPAVDGRIHYAEGVLVGYRWYTTRRVPVAFPFGHGLSYTTFDIGAPVLDATTFSRGHRLVVRVPVVNTGTRPGKEVVQLYVRAPAGAVARPHLELRAFAALHLAPGEHGEARFVLDDRAFARWADPDPGIARDIERLGTSVPWVPAPRAVAPRGWFVDAGRYELHVGRSAADLPHVVVVAVPEGGPAHRT